MTRTIRGYQLTDGQEIDVLVVSRDEAATAFGNLDGPDGSASAEVATAVKPVLLRRKLTNGFPSNEERSTKSGSRSVGEPVGVDDDDLGRDAASGRAHRSPRAWLNRMAISRVAVRRVEAAARLPRASSRPHERLGSTRRGSTIC